MALGKSGLHRVVLRSATARVLGRAGALRRRSATGTNAQHASLDETLSAVVQVKTFINPDGRTVENLGRSREGSGIVIDDNGLVLTIGYLMVEAHTAEISTASGKVIPADIVGYDYESGFGLLRTIEPLKIKPMPIGKSADVKERDRLLDGEFRRLVGVAAGSRAFRCGNLQATGNTCSTTRSSPARRIQPGVAQR